MNQETRNRANGMSEIEGNVTRVGASECGQRASFQLRKKLHTASVILSASVSLEKERLLSRSVLIQTASVRQKNAHGR